jgi:hypothetical protein
MSRALIFIVGLITGSIVGAGGMLLAFPFLFPPPVVAEKAPDSQAEDGSVANLGTFRFDETAPGRDAIHWANGTGGLYRSNGMTILRFDDTFETGPGPDYWIYLNTLPVGEKEAFRSDASKIRLARLKSFQSGQNYTLPRT